MENNNKMKLEFLSHSKNEAFARSVIACFALGLNPSISEIADIKTAVSEAVTNAIVHGYPSSVGTIVLESEIDGDVLHINVFDDGVGIENIDDALEPFFTTKPDDERSGMGFTIMKSFMDEVRVESKKGEGTKVYMLKKFRADE
ncbi:MAG: anti-sigma F factor [Clostridiales bacterium]|nr:anti-sigma F factor [Clostridiales bacterium]